VPVDFEKQSLIDSLRMSGYRTDAPGLFSWLGVTMYLTRDVDSASDEQGAAIAGEQLATSG
jgi:O-methyltransferase involved in polyketide biosynthesis